MKKLALFLAAIVATAVAAEMAHATTANRTFVSNSGVSGNTSLGCSAGSPCDTFANALSVTNAGGEITCLNSGNFGPVTISQPVTINCQGASNGGISVGDTDTAININTTGTVNLIGLNLSGMSANDGVVITSNAVVNIRNCNIYGFSGDGGIIFYPGSSGAVLVVDNVFIANSLNGIYEYVTTGGANMTVRNSNISNNGTGISVRTAGGTHAGATIEQTTLSFNSYDALYVAGPGAVAVIGNSTIVNNGVGVSAQSGGTVYSFKNNQIGGNSTDGTPLTAYPGGPLN